MMKSLLAKFLLTCLICAGAFGTSCILEDKVVQIVFTDKTSAEFFEDSEDELFRDTVVVDYADQIDDILEDNGLTRDSLDTAHLVSASYEVTRFEQNGDWTITGAILVDRMDISITGDTLVSYTNQSVREALNNKKKVKLHPAGVGIMNQALSQYIADTHDPVLRYIVVNGNVEPSPGPGNPIVFDWKAWLTIQVLLTETFEVPDPF
jgi:hypothetical protein